MSLPHFMLATVDALTLKLSLESIYPLPAFPWNLGIILMKKRRFQKLKYFTWK